MKFTQELSAKWPSLVGFSALLAGLIVAVRIV